MPVIQEIDEQRRTFCRAMHAEAIARDEGGRLDTTVVLGDEVDAIVEFAGQYRADPLLGGTAHGVTLAAPCSVQVVK